MQQYINLLNHILNNGVAKDDRTNTGTISTFGYQMRFNMADGFPLVTTKKCHLRSIIHELLWFLAGDTNIKYLNQNGVTIWDEWADADGGLGPVYGKQWRSWEDKNGRLIDQIKNLISEIKTNPYSRRLIVNAWNVGELDNMAIPPCHMMFQFYVINGRLDLQLYQRSADIAVGVPFNIASYALLNMMIAQECGLTPGIFTHTFGDAHIYSDHLDGIKAQLKREPGPLPRVTIANKPIFDLKFEDFELHDYVHQGFIKFPVAV